MRERRERTESTAIVIFDEHNDSVLFESESCVGERHVEMDGADVHAPSPSEAAATSSSTIEDETATREPPPKKPRKEGVAPAAGSWPERAPRPPDAEQFNPYAKRKVALLLAYNGVGYSGLQKNPDVSTIEEVLEAAIHRAGGISAENFGTLQKVSWSRAGRTDKGVHALGQIISVKLIIEPDGLLERINTQLGDVAISVLGMERVTNNFCAHTLCTSREYEYLLPVSVLRSSSGSSAGSSGGSSSEPLSESESKRLEEILKRYQGTHSFHNFTDGKLTGADSSAMRYMIHLRLGAPLSLSGVHYVSIRLHGQSFLLHQIRKMMALLCATYRGDVADDTIETALKKSESMPQVPLAPSCALMLRSALYANYERRRVNEKNCGRNSVHFPECEGAQQGFLTERILPHVAECEREGEFERFVGQLEWYRQFRRESLQSGSSSSGKVTSTESAAPAEEST